jgi:membrane protein DedA with SNARE-associated domain
VDAHGRWLTLSCEDLDRAKGWFDRHGGAAVFIGRLIPGIRTFISVPAGFAEMPFAPFLAYSTAGTALWTAALAIAGRMLGSQYDQVSTYLGPISWIVLGGILVLYVYRVVKWRRSSSVEDDQESQAVSA